MFKIGDEVEVESCLMGNEKGPKPGGIPSHFYKALKGKIGVVVEPSEAAVMRGLVTLKIRGEVISMFPWRLRLTTLEANE